MSAYAAFRAVLARDVRLAWRTGGAGLALAFFLLVILLLPLAAGAEPGLIRRVGPALVWIAALLAVLLTLEGLFQVDLDAGVLDLVMQSTLALEAAILAKALAHWLSVGVPLSFLSIAGALLLGLSVPASLILALSLLIGMPGLTFTGVVAGALTAGVRRGSLLITLLLLPLYTPFVIFGSGAATLAANPAQPLSFWPSLMLLGAASLVAAIGALLFAASAVRSQLD